MSDLQIDYSAWSQPKEQGISACIRVRNESQFMALAVRSFLPYVDEVVLCVQPSEDDTLEIANQLADEYEQVNVHFYELVPDWIDTPGFYSKDPDAPGHMVHMSNWALSKCRYSWVLKVEGDVIASERVGLIRQILEDSHWSPSYYGMVILNVAGENYDQISLQNPRNGGWDEALFPNNPALVRFMRRGKWEVAVPQIGSICLGWNLWHMKRCKRGKTDGWNGEEYIPWTDANVQTALTAYNKQRGAYPGFDDALMRVPWMARDELVKRLE